jgi:hypothetical protein
MSGDSFLKCSSGIKLDSNAAPEGVDVEVDAKNLLVAKYLDLFGNAKSGTIIEISHPRAINFEIKFEDSIRRQLEASSSKSMF